MDSTDKDSLSGVYGTIPMPEWKHKVLKVLAKLFFLRDVSAVIIVHGETHE